MADKGMVGDTGRGLGLAGGGRLDNKEGGPRLEADERGRGLGMTTGGRVESAEGVTPGGRVENKGRGLGSTADKGAVAAGNI